MGLFREVADIQTSDMLNLPVPKANYRTVAVEASEIQKRIVGELAERAESVRDKKVKPEEDNMLKIWAKTGIGSTIDESPPPRL